MRAQAAFEYMLVVIIALAFMVPLWTYIFTVNNEANDELSLSYARNAVESIVSTADLVYSQGEPAKLRIDVLIPDNLQSYNITNRTVTLNILYANVVTDVFASSKARLNGTIPTTGGHHWLDIEAIEDANYDINIHEA
jgi:hypothetical protein